MEDAMVTARMSKQRKAEGQRILSKAGLTASQAINMLFDRLVREQDASFLAAAPASSSQAAWQEAAGFVDSLIIPADPQFVIEDKASMKAQRLKARGLM